MYTINNPNYKVSSNSQIQILYLQYLDSGLTSLKSNRSEISIMFSTICKKLFKLNLFKEIKIYLSIYKDFGV